MLSFSNDKIYLNNNIGDIFMLINVEKTITPEEYIYIFKLHSLICNENCLLYDEKYINFDLLHEFNTKCVSNDLNLPLDRYNEIMNMLRN